MPRQIPEPRPSMRDQAISAAGEGSGTAKFEVLVRPIPGTGATVEQGVRIETLFRRMLIEYPWPAFGDVVVHFLAGQPGKVGRTDTDNKPNR